MAGTVEQNLSTILSRSWWLVLLRGVAAIVFGVLTWFYPAITLTVLMLFFGAYLLVDGALSVWTAISGRRHHEYWWVLLLGGMVGIVVGIFTLVIPGITALALLFYIAIWAVATGVLQIVAAIRLRKEIQGEWLLILSGLLSVIFGLLLIMQPRVGALAVLWLIAVYAVLFGILLVLLAFRMRSVGTRLHS
jgi:uncharacterized membrane protein HdeD (DUF308 family)